MLHQSITPAVRARWLGGLVFLALLLLPLAAWLFDDPYLLSLFSRIMIYALAAVSLDLVLGYAGLVSLGHAAFIGIGAYSVGILAFHLQEGSTLFGLPGTNQAWLSLPLAIACSACIAGIIGALSLRTRGVYFIMITLAFAQMLYYLFVSLEAYGGDDGLSLWGRNELPFIDLGSDLQFYYLCFVTLVLFIGLSHRLVHSRFGRVIRGSRENALRMEALGFPTLLYQWLIFTLSGAGAGLAGALLANQNEFVSPALLHWTQSGEILVMVLLGGMGTLVGPVLGAAALLLMEEWLAALTEHWMVLLGPFLIIVVLFARRGLYGLITGRDEDG